MKIVVINGQNHKGSTYNMGNILAHKLSGDIVEYFLPREKNGWNQADVNYWKEKGWTEKKRPWKNKM